MTVGEIHEAVPVVRGQVMIPGTEVITDAALVDGRIDERHGLADNALPSQQSIHG
jgi:hypothetical protein